MEEALKIQVLLDYLRGEVKQVEITEGCKNDQSYEGHLDRIEKGSLNLQDLGYFKVSTLEKIAKKEAFFVSRYFYPTTILDGDGEKLDLLKELKKAGNQLVKKVFIGKEKKIESRLIALKLSDEATKKRIEKITKSAKKKGRIPKQETLEIANWSIYITNVPENMLSDELIHLVYSLRWQIELFFKLCKSEAGIDKISGKKTYRVLCEIYAKLIGILLLMYICFPIKWYDNLELSYSKAYKQLSGMAIKFFENLKTKYRLKKMVKLFYKAINGLVFKDRCRKRLSTCQKIYNALEGISV